jgi:hypothetical protein
MHEICTRNAVRESAMSSITLKISNNVAYPLELVAVSIEAHCALLDPVTALQVLEIVNLSYRGEQKDAEKM